MHRGGAVAVAVWSVAAAQPSSELLGWRAISVAVLDVRAPVVLTVAPPPAERFNATAVWPFGHADTEVWPAPGGGAVALDPWALGRECGEGVYICNGMLYACAAPAVGPCTLARPTRTFSCEAPWESWTCLDAHGHWVTDEDIGGGSTVEWSKDGRWIALRDPPALATSIIFCWFLVFILFALMTSAVVRDLTRIDIAATAAGGLALTQLAAPFTPSVVLAGPGALEWAVDVLTGLVAGISVGTCLYAPQRTTSEVCCLAALSISYPEHIVGRQPAILIQMVCALLICALAGGRREPFALPAVGWAVLVLIYPALAEALISIDTAALYMVSAVVAVTVSALAATTTGTVLTAE